MPRHRLTSEERRTAGRVRKACWRARMARGMQGASSRGRPAVEQASASMSGNVAASAAPSGSPKARINVAGRGAPADRRAKGRVGGTMAGKSQMAGTVGSAMDDVAEGEVDSAMEEGVGGAMEDEAMEEGVDDEVEDVMVEGAGGMMGNETEEKEVGDETEDEAEEGVAGMIGDDTEEEVDREVDEIDDAIGGRVKGDEEEDDDDNDVSSHTETEGQAQVEHGGSESTHGEESQASPSPEANEADKRPDLPLNLGSHLLKFWGCVAGTHQHGDCDENDDNQHENHRSLKAVNQITGRLPNVIGKPGFLGPDNLLRARHVPRDWQLAFEGREGSGNDEDDRNGAVSELSGSEDEGRRQHPRISLCLRESELAESPDTIAEFDVDSLSSMTI